LPISAWLMPSLSWSLLIMLFSFALHKIGQF